MKKRYFLVTLLVLFAFIGTVWALGNINNDDVLSDNRIVQSGDLSNFTSKMPIASIRIKDLSNIKADIQRANSPVSVSNTMDGAVARNIGNGTMPRGGYATGFDNVSYDYRYSNAAILEDGTEADLIVNFSNIKMALQSGSGNGTYWYTISDGQSNNSSRSTLKYPSLKAETKNTQARYGLQADVTVKVVNEGTNDPVDGTFIYTVSNIDVSRHGEISYKNIPGAGTYVDDDNHDYSNNNRGAYEPNYYYSESVRVNSELASDIFIPGQDVYGVFIDDNGTFVGADLKGEATDSNSYSYGFAALGNAKGVSVTATGASIGGNYDSGDPRDGAKNKIISFMIGGLSHDITSSSGDNGTILLWDSGEINSGKKLQNGQYPLTFDIPNGKDVTYKLQPYAGYELDKLIVNGQEVDAKPITKCVNKTVCHYEYTMTSDDPNQTIHVTWKLKSSTIDCSSSVNSESCNVCKKVNTNEIPSGYSYFVDEDGKNVRGFYMGGTAPSILQADSGNVTIDNDDVNYASILPYGSIYVDTSKLNWDQSDNFVINIKDTEHFKWIGPDTLKDANGNTPSANIPKASNPNPESAIAYYGYIHSYLNYQSADGSPDNTLATSQNVFDGKYHDIDVIRGTNTIEAKNGEYLYEILYKDAAVMKDGTRNDVSIKVTKVELESVTTTNEKAYIGLQLANRMQNASNYLNPSTNQPYFAPNVEIPNVRWNSATSSRTNPQKIRNAVGGNTTFTIGVVDKNGNPVEGSIFYEAKDLDVASYESFWGRLPSDGDFENGTEWYKYGEGMEIINGALSYAVTPKYDHANETEINKGRLPINTVLNLLGKSQHYDSPLRVEGVSEDAKTANGLRFVTSSTQKNRGNNGGFNNANYQYSGNAYLSGNNFALDATTTMRYENWSAVRQDGNTHDSGFVVVLDASGSTLKWSGSQHSGNATVDTTLFENSVYTFIEQSHGTGGGIHIEEYDLACNCEKSFSEGIVTVALHSNPIVTLVPEEGYSVKSFKVGDNTYNIKDLFNDNKTEVSIIGTNIKAKKLSDNSYALTFTDIESVTKIHVDFEADYYFTKVWNKELTGNEKLYLKATPYIVNTDGKLEKYTGYDEYSFQATKKDAYKVSGNTWYFKYPSSGTSTWKELPIEAKADSHDKNHVNRIYWFVTEDKVTPNDWELLNYSNTKIGVPAIIQNTEYKDKTDWAKRGLSNITVENIESKTDMVYMSVFEDKGGVITNTKPEPTKPVIPVQPNTGDTILRYTGLLLISISTMGFSLIYAYKYRKELND